MNFFEVNLTKKENTLYIHHAAFEFPVTNEESHRIGNLQGLILGIRPEDIHDAALQQMQSASRYPAEVLAVEPIGAETYLHLKLGNDPVMARVKPETKAKMTEPLQISLDFSKAHFFDPATGSAL